MKIYFHNYSDLNYNGFISIIMVLKCAGNVQKVLNHKSFHQVLYLKPTNNKCKILLAEIQLFKNLESEGATKI